MNKQDGAFLTIGELAAELGVPQHILRYWETRFPSLRPLQRAGNRRYYRPEDVVLARQIHHLLTVERYTVRGAQQALAGNAVVSGQVERTVGSTAFSTGARESVETSDHDGRMSDDERTGLISRLTAIRAKLESALP